MNFQVYAATYTVSPGGLAGANSTVHPGDTVILRGGTYSAEYIAPARSGTAHAPITYTSAEGEIATLTNRWADLEDRDHITIQNLQFDHGSDWGGIRLKNSNYSKLLNNVIKNGDGDAIHVKNDSKYNLIEGNDIGDAVHGCIDIEGPTGNGSVEEFNTISPRFTVIRNNWFHNGLHTNIQVEANVHHIVLEGNRISEGKTGGLQLDASAIIVRRNLMYENEEAGISVESNFYKGTRKYCNHNRIYNNVIYDNLLSLNPERHGGQETNTTLSVNDNIFKNNIYNQNGDQEIYFWAGDGSEINPFSHNNIISYNTGADVVKWRNSNRSLVEIELEHPENFYDNIEAQPDFVDAQNADFHLNTGSPMIDAGDYLTRTSSAGSGTDLFVVDAGYFFDGYGIVQGDFIQLEGETQKTLITGIDYDNNIITVEQSLSWATNQGVSLAYNGNAPDIGAVEFGVPGDFDGDGDVDGADFLAWQRVPSVGSLADWQTNFGTVASLSTTSAAVPEPATLLLGCVALGMVGGWRKRKV